MYISEEIIKAVIKSDIYPSTLWIIKALEAEETINIDLGSQNKSSKKRPFIILKLLDETNEVCICFFSTQSRNHIEFNLRNNCECTCAFALKSQSYVFKNEVYRFSSDIFYSKLVQYCGVCSNVDYLFAKLQGQLKKCT